MSYTYLLTLERDSYLDSLNDYYRKSATDEKTLVLVVLVVGCYLLA